MRIDFAVGQEGSEFALRLPGALQVSRSAH